MGEAPHLAAIAEFGRPTPDHELSAPFFRVHGFCLLRATLISGGVSKLTSGDFPRISTLSSSFMTSGVVLCGQPVMTALAIWGEARSLVGFSGGMDRGSFVLERLHQSPLFLALPGSVGSRRDCSRFTKSGF